MFLFMVGYVYMVLSSLQRANLIAYRFDMN